MAISNTVSGFLVLCGTLLGALAHAESASVNVAPSPKYQQECTACHRNAAQGSFNEREIKIPK